MKFEGVIPALVTPIKDGKLDVPNLEKLIEDLLAEGADGFYVGGGTGEGVTISFDLHKEVTKEAIRITAHRVPVIVHVARINYEEMIALAKHAEAMGADCVSAVPPFFYPYNEKEIYAYYKGLCDSVKIPVMIYNSPLAAVNLSLDLLEELFKIPNLTAIKWTNYNYYTVFQFKARVPDANVINGPDELAMLGLAAGCDGCIGTTYNIQFSRIKAIYNAVKEGRVEDARRLQAEADKIIAVLCSVNALKATKIVLKKRGYGPVEQVFPFLPLSEAEEEKLFAALREAGLENV